MSKTEYNTIHQWNLRHWHKTGICEHCSCSSKTEWANKSGDYLKGVKSDWLELCASCHSRYDFENFGRNYSLPYKHTQFISIIDGLIKIS